MHLAAARAAPAPALVSLAQRVRRLLTRSPLARSQEELYSYVTVVDTPEGFANLGTKTVETA